MRIVSLLPSLTELVCALGHRESLVGVTHECDYPPGVEDLPHLTRSRLPAAATSREIDTLVSQERGSLYELDAGRLADLRPDLILTQEQCDVCAVNETTVRRVAGTLPRPPSVESVNPTDLAGVFAMFRRVGEILDASEAAERLHRSFEQTADEIARRTAGLPRRRAALLEWVDPPFVGGHWNPEVLAAAGGVEVLGRPGAASRRATWEELNDADPEVLLLSPCGFSLDRTLAELAQLAGSPGWQSLRPVRAGGVVAIDGSSYFSRPGPRLEASLRIAAAALYPGPCGDLAPDAGWRPQRR